MSTSFKKIFVMLVMAICFSVTSVLASDNVLQAVQINGVNDSYNIILKSDDVAEVKKTVQAPNKMIILLKGIRASKTINTIYNNTSTVDSVVVEPINDDTVRILIQAANVGMAEIHFDSLKTPLGVLGNTHGANKPNGEITLSDPVGAYRPVYNEEIQTDSNEFSLVDTSSAFVGVAKKVMNNEKLSWLVTFGLFGILLISGMKLVKGKDNEIKIGLSQSMQEREMDLYRGMGLSNMANLPQSGVAGQSMSSPIQNAGPSSVSQKNLSNANYGLRSYQNGTRSPYATPEIQRPNVTSASQSIVAPSLQQVARNIVAKNQSQSMMQNTVHNPSSVATQQAQRPKSANIDSMKFLESMTKIYEKNGRSDLAQGLKSNIKKAKANLV